ncbi:TPA: DUF1127 domain-containing protein [Vibrio vulnificus]|uniref:DUF1127 domain-containing protein n=1 Tax=Vibrio vulnificus TaxID=672 RepID=UPI0010298782|nr:DUF1127 domain-containing protein [Vibrio vulnificus]EGR0207570.1 DUF1127 domain-containing protein [Vibrio vulnificus]EJX1090864.1 DUF1127 domain-containing protein [Vibrio vulnificus]ELH3490092.1 DUF1127 domain-containing protein [Vibrio vulnificus]MCU8499315.1 DUF1127 domain-containing protein [Vibrio vulnificus]RZQ01286.1 DUF1127 domain-containing protein [Vibrio vulnificus]
MRHSIYLKLATILVQADLKREEREWAKRVRRSSYEIPWNNAFLLRDIGLDEGGRANLNTTPDEVKVARRIRHIRRVLSARIPT